MNVYTDRTQIKQKKKTSKLPLLLLVIVVISVTGFFFGKNWYDSAIYDPLAIDESYELTVAEGETFLDIVSRLAEESIVKSREAVQLYLRIEQAAPNIKTGTYIISEGYAIPDLIALLEGGAVKPAVWVTIKEGLRYEQISEIFEEKLGDVTSFSTAEFEQIVENPDLAAFTPDIKTFIDAYKPTGGPLRGFLYPDTYRFDYGMTTQQIIEVMISNFKIKLETNIDLSAPLANQSNFTSVYDAIILASIIEREASAWDDRAEIAGVFHNRLNINMALQSDATVNFITGKNDPGVSFTDKDIDSPYNTYVYPGLPPTPINNPRIESIVAALNPNETPYYYFYHTPQGQTFFNETFDEHAYGVCRDLGC